MIKQGMGGTREEIRKNAAGIETLCLWISVVINNKFVFVKIYQAIHFHSPGFIVHKSHLNFFKAVYWKSSHGDDTFGWNLLDQGHTYRPFF